MWIDESLVAKRPLTDVIYAIIHHTDGPQTEDITEVATEEKTDQGFVTVGYHELATKKPGRWILQSGRAINDIPAAAFGMNEVSYDIAIAGNYHPQANVPLDTLDESVLHLVASQILLAKTKLPNLKYLMAHRDVATIMGKRGLNPGNYSTKCPGDILYAKMWDLRAYTGLHSPPEIE